MKKDIQENNKYSKKAITAFIFSILSFFLSFFGIIFWVVSLILGILALKDIKKNPQLKGNTLAWFSILFYPIVMIIVFLGLSLAYLRSTI